MRDNRYPRRVVSPSGLRRLALGAVLVIESLSACLLKENPEFMEATLDQSTGASGDTTRAGDSSTGTTAAPPCDDSHEPNDQEASAAELGVVVGVGPTMDTTGSIGGDDPDDWFHFRVEDPPMDRMPSAGTQSATRVCIFVECLEGTTLLPECASLGEPESSPAGRLGCCDFGNTTAPYRCGGSQVQDVDVYVRLEAPPDPACMPYTLSYRSSGML